MLTGMISSVGPTVSKGHSGEGSLSNVYIDPNDQNFGIGENLTFHASAENNIAIGTDALNSSGADCDYNIGIGTNALTAVSTGDNNIGIGYGAGSGLTDVTDNVIIGHDALSQSNGAYYSVAIGSLALKNNSTGVQNIGIGNKAGTDVGAGVANTIVGHLSGQGIDGESYNTIFGNQALSNASSNATSATVIGYLAAGSGIVTTAATGIIAIGYRALNNLTSGDGNVGIGYDTGYSTTSGTRNTAIGYRAFRSNQLGHSTVALGYEALFTANHVANDGAVAIGYKAGRLMNCSGGTTANGNTLIGYFSGFDPNIGDGETEGGLTSGTKCTAVGMETLGANANGNLTCARTTVMGYRAGYSFTGADCDDNTFIGYQAGDSVTTGSDNTLIGSGTDTSAVGGANQIVIGYNATGIGDNYAVIGNASISRVYMNVNGDGVIYANGTIETSDIRFKENIKECDLGLGFINKINPVKYNFKEDDNTKYGIVAQEVLKALEDTGIKESSFIATDNPDKLGANYVQFIAPLIKAVQELSQQIEDLKKG